MKTGNEWAPVLDFINIRTWGFLFRMCLGILSEASVQWRGEARKAGGLETANKSWESSETFVVQVHASGETDLLDICMSFVLLIKLITVKSKVM